jgi:hypothetical protein
MALVFGCVSIGTQVQLFSVISVLRPFCFPYLKRGLGCGYAIQVGSCSGAFTMLLLVLRVFPNQQKNGSCRAIDVFLTWDNGGFTSKYTQFISDKMYFCEIYLSPQT